MIFSLDGTCLAVQRILTRLSSAAVVFVMAVGMAGGCASGGPDPSALSPTTPGVPVLTLLDTVVIPVVVHAPDGRRESWMGSLSGLARDARSGRYLAVVDDRLMSRVAWLDITAQSGRLSVTPGEVVPIRPAAGVDERLVTFADLESLVSLPDGTWVASEEGHFSTGAPDQPAKGEWPPALLTIDSALVATGVLTWPARFALGPERGGVRDNQGFESLTRTTDGRLIAGLEQPLHADLAAPLRNGRPFSGGRGGPSRVVELVPDAGHWRPAREWIYPLSPTAVREGERICDDGENGLTELLALDGARLIGLERACLLSPGAPAARNTARLYLVDLADADDVSPAGGVPVATARPVRKTLLVDFDDLIPRWPPALKNLDNFEALAFGPPLPNGQPTLLVMSDDNFRDTQNTVFVWFRIEERGERR
jgi:Esterase-like activity of phytase